MVRAREILEKIQEISRHYLSGRPPIAVSGLTDELHVSKEELLPGLKVLERSSLISFYTLAEAIRLTPKGSELIVQELSNSPTTTNRNKNKAP